jgi:hypothetical protein
MSYTVLDVDLGGEGNRFAEMSEESRLVCSSLFWPRKLRVTMYG